MSDLELASATPVTQSTVSTPAELPTLSAEDSATLHSSIKANFNNAVDVKDVKFNFKKDDLGNKRPSVTIPLAVPSVEGIIAILETGGKGLELLLEAVQTVIYDQARSIVNDKEDITATDFPYEQLGWDFIANMPKAERRGGGIPKEVWEAFSVDYIAVMPSATGKSVEAVTNGARILVQKFSAYKTNKPVLELFKGYLALYANTSPNAETYQDCLEFLNEKVTKLLTMDDADLLKNL
jgi:hypothetical protein